MLPLNRWFKDPFPALSHWFGAGLALVVLFVLPWRAAPRGAAVAALAVYAVSLVVLYAASAVAHTARCSEAMTARLKRMDYAAIFLLIAGTYTPLCVVTLGGRWGVGLLAVEWLLAVAGIIAVTRAAGCAVRTRVTLYLCMGWLALIATGPILTALPRAGVIWLIAGGVVYSVGAVIYVTGQPRLWPGRFGTHDLWHLLVLIGSGCHYVVMSSCVALPRA
jgi:hemolysin III